MHTYTIREISELFSLPASTLRYYESEGLLPLVEKNSSGQRIYTKEHIDRLQCINCFKRTGMTIPQLRKFFEYETDEALYINDIIQLLEDQEKQLTQKMKKKQCDYSAHVHHKVRYYKAIRHALENDLPLPEWKEE